MAKLEIAIEIIKQSDSNWIRTHNHLVQSESTHYSWLNVKELLTQNRRNIWSLSDNSGIWTAPCFVEENSTI